MKKVLVLNGDSYVGRHVVKAFHQSQEYDVEITRSKSDARRAATTRATAMAGAHGWMWSDTMDREGGLAAPPANENTMNSPHGRRKKSRGGTNNNNINNNVPSSSSLPATTTTALTRLQLQQEAEERASLPAEIRPCVRAIVPKHNDDTHAFRARLLANDVVIAVLDDDAYEATCAIRILESTHYEVEKTFVLVSSAVTWASTLEAERARARLTRQRERAEARNTFLEEMLDEEEEERGEEDDDAANANAAAASARAARRAMRRRELEARLPPSLRDPQPGEDEEEIREMVPDRVFTEDAYAQRVPHPRFQHWHALEHLVKRANTQTLHTYVVFAGLPYGAGEGESTLFGLLRSAWYHQPLLQYGPGTNAIPMIHVQDLAAILFRLGNSYDTLEERYVFAVDQGKVTQRQLLHAVQAKLGGAVQPATCGQYHLLDVNARVTAKTATSAPNTVLMAANAAAGANPTFGTVAAASTSLSNGGMAGSGSNGHPPSGPNASGSSLSHSAASGSAAGQAPITSATPATTTAAAISANLVRLDRLELPLPSSPQELFRVFGNTPCWGDGNALLSALVLSDVQAEPAAVLNFYPAEEWVALEGFTLSLDLVLAQFREAHGYAYRPVRALITGPPLSGAEGLAVLVGHQCHAPVLTPPTIVRDYTAHVAAVREALRRLLVRRLARRRARVHARQVQEATEAKVAERAARAERRRELQAARLAKEKRRRLKTKKGDKRGQEADEHDSSDEGEGEGEEDGMGEARGDAEDGDGSSATEDSLDASISVFIPSDAAKQKNKSGTPGEDDDEAEEDNAGAEEDNNEEDDIDPPHQRGGTARGRSHRAKAILVRSAEEVVSEAYIRGAAAAGGSGAGSGEEDDVALDGMGDGIDGILDEEQEEAVEGEDGAAAATWLDQLEERDAERQAELLEGQELLPESVAAATTQEGGQDSSAFQMPRFAARRRGRAFARDVDQQELRCIAALRREYLLGLKVLALRVSPRNGRLPRPPPPPAEYGEEEEGEGEAEDAQRAVKGISSNGKAQRSAAGRDAEGEEDDDAPEGGSDSETGPNNGDSDTEGEEEEDEEEQSDDGDDESRSGAAAGVDDASSKTEEAEGHADSAASRYLDAALAFMFRWRLRQSDCRCQGYVLGNFPQTLAQAVLCFRANEAELEDAELRRQRVLSPLLTRLDDHENAAGSVAAADVDGDEATPLPPPLDEDFPLPDIASMEESQLRALERAHNRARGVFGGAPASQAAQSPPATGDGGEEEEAEAEAVDPEEVMAPVDEALFVEHVVHLQANPTLLRSTVEALETHLKNTTADGAAAAEATADGGEVKAPPSQPTSGEMGGEADALEALRRLLSAAPYPRQLEDYVRHHAPTAPPTQSLLAWLRAVTTTPALGARPAPVIVPLSTADGQSVGGGFASSDAAASAGGEGDGGNGAATLTLEAPATVRTAEIVTLPCPVLSVPQIQANWSAAYTAAHACGGDRTGSLCPATVEKEEGLAVWGEKLPLALLRLAPLFWTGEATASAAATSSRRAGQVKSLLHAHCTTTPASSLLHQNDAARKALPPALQELQRVLCARLVPPRRLAACAVDGPRRFSGGGSDQLPLMTVSTRSIATAATLPSHGHATATTTTTAGAASGLYPHAGSGTEEEMNSLSTITRERAQLTELEKREVQLADLATREGAAQVFQERAALRKLQLAEESRDAASLLQMPAETYLMKYVLPSLTPAMTEVVRTRPDDPVTALANVLFDYHRRTSI